MIGCGLDPTGLGQEPVTVSRNHGNKIPGSIKDEEFLDDLSDYELINKLDVSWNLRSASFYYRSVHFTHPPRTVTDM
jgi:hypothetical protein